MSAAASPRTPRARSPARTSTTFKPIQNGDIKPRYPTVQELEARAEAETTVGVYSSIDSLLQAAEQCNQQVHTDVGFKRPDRAYIESLKSAEILRLIAQHREFPYLNTDRKSRHIKIRKEHEAQRPMLAEIRTVIEDSNKDPKETSNSYRKPVNKQSLGNGESRPLSASQSADIKRVTPQSSNRSSLQAQARPTDELHFNTHSSNGVPSSPAADPLFTRFSQLRVNQAPTQKKLPYPIDDSFTYISPSDSYPSKSSTQPKSQSNITLRNDRTASPKLQSNSSTSLPPHPPKLPINSRINTSLPRAPSPIYSPARNIAAPSSIEPPRTTARSTVGTVGKAPKSPLNGMGLSNGHERRDSSANSHLPELPRSPKISAQELSGLFRYYDILVIDVRTRDLFDDGHIFGKSVVCIEPLSLRHGISSEDLLDGLIYSPEEELHMLNRIHSYDLVVFHDQNTTYDRFLQGLSKTSPTNWLRLLYESLTEFNYRNALKRTPVILVGGLDSWIDLVGPQALQASKTLNIPQSQRLSKPPKRPPHRVSVSGGNSSRDIHMRRLRDYRPLNADEEKAWREKARNEEVEPANIRDFQADSDDDSQIAIPVHDINDFFRRFPDASAIPVSMVSPRQDIPPTRRQPISGTPSRPPPIVSRPSYSGVSEREGFQLSPSSRQPTSAQPPLYISKAFHSLKLPRTGLVNMGQTCYMNATIQCLLATVPLSRLFLDETWRKHVQKNRLGSEGVMPSHFSNLIRRLWKPQEQAYCPTTFRSFCARINPEWGLDRQQDAKEFYDWLTDILHEDLNVHFMRNHLRELTPQEELTRERLPISTVSRTEWERWSHKNLSRISDLFAGQHASSLRCTTCNNTSTIYEAFFSIVLEIPPTGTSTLTDCLRSYCQEEMLTGTDEWVCPVCKCRREAVKRLTITRLPQVLTIHFKRFSNLANGSFRKVHSLIDFPLHGLNMGPYMANTRIPQRVEDEVVDTAVTPPFTYDAYAVMRHIGTTMSSGHYVAMVKDSARNTWVNFNDSDVRNFDPARLQARDRLQNSEAYIVFYERARAK